ncbi:MAG TPA: 1-deoxy-D-xylulose-5-phosphate reductoisomerase, partial [Candidatus Limiplasma stercoravium]|nr:1-deoxy-D-xylulose-5-phosphate reductoisomerase [Candidatus Limiplasma stercoravium]
VAVERLLQDGGRGEMTVGRIFDTVEETLQQAGHLPADSLEDVLEADRIARSVARARLNRL